MMKENGNTKEYEVHPAAEMFPQMNEHEINEMAEDITRNGLMESIVLFEGKILDGRNRLIACNKAGVEPKFVDLPRGMSPVYYVWSQNYVRRHLSASQRAMAAQVMHEMVAKEAKQRRTKGGTLSVRQGVEIIPQAEKGRTRDKLAEMSGVNARYISDAKNIIDASPELAEEIRDGITTIPAAKRKLAEQQKGQSSERTPKALKVTDLNKFADRLATISESDPSQSATVLTPEFRGGLVRLLDEIIHVIGCIVEIDEGSSNLGNILLSKADNIQQLGNTLLDDSCGKMEVA